MSKFDIFIIIVAIVGAVRGYRRGFILSIFDIGALVAASFCGISLVDAIINWLKHRYTIDTELLPFIAFSIAFIAILIAVKLIGYWIKRTVDDTAFSGAFDGPLGGVIGVLKIMFWASLLFWLINSTHVMDLKKYTKESIFYSSVTKLAPGLAKWMSTWFPSLCDVFNR